MLLSIIRTFGGYEIKRATGTGVRALPHSTKCIAPRSNAGTCKLVERGVLLKHALRETQLIFAREKYWERRFDLAMRKR